MKRTMEVFLKKFDLIRDPITTQIDNYENLTDCFDAIKRINTVLIDLNRDLWSYISYELYQTEGC